MYLPSPQSKRAVSSPRHARASSSTMDTQDNVSTKVAPGFVSCRRVYLCHLTTPTRHFPLETGLLPYTHHKSDSRMVRITTKTLHPPPTPRSPKTTSANFIGVPKLALDAYSYVLCENAKGHLSFFSFNNQNKTKTYHHTIILIITLLPPNNHQQQKPFYCR